MERGRRLRDIVGWFIIVFSARFSLKSGKCEVNVGKFDEKGD
jgi:hypothetical protein